jgi:threonine dehydrogenase-like Zn-dependent dehydrogenase
MRGNDINVEDIPDPVPGRGQVIIAPHSTGICGSDLHFRSEMGELAALDPHSEPPGVVPGHEFAGHVVAIGPDTPTELAEGDLVTAIPFTHGPAGPEIIGLSPTFGGGLAELTAVDAERTVKLPQGVGTRLGSLTEPIAVAVHAFARSATSGPIAIVGSGPIGLGIVAAAVAADRHPVIAIDPSEARRAIALRLGADAAYAPGSDLTDMLAEHGFTPGTLSPLLDAEPATPTIFECVGRPEVVQNVIATAPAHSRVVLAGICSHAVEVNPLQMIMAEISIETSFAYRPRDFNTALRHLQEQPEYFASLITSERPLDQTYAAFEDLASGLPDEIKILITPGHGAME